MKEEWKKVLCAMRDEGYCVIVWTPEKLGDVDPEGLEEASISFGIDYLIDYEDAPKKGETQ